MWRIHETHVNESWHTWKWVMHTYEWVMAHMWITHVSTPYHKFDWVTSNVHQMYACIAGEVEQCLILETHVNESWHTREWAIAHTCGSHVIYTCTAGEVEQWLGLDVVAVVLTHFLRVALRTCVMAHMETSHSTSACDLTRCPHQQYTKSGNLAIVCLSSVYVCRYIDAKHSTCIGLDDINGKCVFDTREKSRMVWFQYWIVVELECEGKGKYGGSLRVRRVSVKGCEGGMIVYTYIRSGMRYSIHKTAWHKTAWPQSSQNLCRNFTSDWYLCHDLTCETWLMWHDTLTHVPILITHVPWLIYVCAMMYSHVWHDLVMYLRKGQRLCKPLLCFCMYFT